MAKFSVLVVLGLALAVAVAKRPHGDTPGYQPRIPNDIVPVKQSTSIPSDFLFEELVSIRDGKVNVTMLHYMVTMADGVKLWTSVWYVPQWLRPDSKSPAMYDKSPYGPLIEETADLWLAEGFVAVMQNQRGTGLSEGDFSFWHNSSSDALSTMNWIAEQEWSSGEVFECGFSADGINALTSILEFKPRLKGQFVAWATADSYPLVWQNGAYRQCLVGDWMQTQHAQRPWRPSYDEEMQSHEAYSEWWEDITVTDYSVVQWGAVHWAGWYDIFSNHQLVTYANYRAGATGRGAGRQYLVVGPRGHCFFEKKVEWRDDRDAEAFALDLSYKLFAAEIDNSTLPIDTQLKAMTLYVMGPGIPKLPEGAVGDYWTTLDDWPATTATTLYLAADGVLSPTAPAAAAPALNATYTYDPNNTVPTVGGENLFCECGPADQRGIETRPDVLLFTSAPFEEATPIVGAMSIDLWVSSDRNDTDFTVKITDVYPEAEGGDSRLLTDSIQRMRWRVNNTTPVPMVPGEVYKITIEMWKKAYVFNKGHAVRVAISSSNYPRFSANPNNGLPLIAKGPVLVAENGIHFGSAAMPAALTLPVVTFDQIPNNVVMF